MKKLFALLTLILTAATLARSGRDGERAYLYDPLPVILPEGINHLLDNSQSELEEMKGFDRVVERFMQRWEITGASIAVMKSGRLLYSKGYGWADKERNVRTDVKHIFRIASLSKLITATGIMRTACYRSKTGCSANRAFSATRLSEKSATAGSKRSLSSTCSGIRAATRSVPAIRCSAR